MPLGIFLIISNAFALVLFGVDKCKAANGAWRIPDTILLLVAFCGPFGAYAGMLLFRHKTRKVKFILVPVFMFIQSALLVYLIFVT